MIAGPGVVRFRQDLLAVGTGLFRFELARGLVFRLDEESLAASIYSGRRRGEPSRTPVSETLAA